MSLLDLNYDIRFIIYEELLIGVRPIKIIINTGHDNLFKYRRPPAKVHPAILRVNKLICNEALPVLYSHNRLSFEDGMCDYPHFCQGVKAFVGTIGANATLVRHIGLHSCELAVHCQNVPVLSVGIRLKDLLHTYPAMFPNITTYELWGGTGLYGSPEPDDLGDLVDNESHIPEDEFYKAFK